MRVVIIGTGNVATVLGRKIAQAGHTISQVAGRNGAAAAELAAALNSTAITDYQQLDPDAGLYLISVSDTALYTLPATLPISKGIVAHTAGSVPMDVLASPGRSHGILYPLQSLRKEMIHLPEIPLLVDASDDATRETLRSFAGTISQQVAPAGDEKRMQLHLGAVLVSNFTNHLYALAHRYCVERAIPFSLLQPLIEETATRLRQYAPEEVQTGPAARKDYVTIEKHRKLIEGTPSLLKVYDVMNGSILDLS